MRAYFDLVQQEQLLDVAVTNRDISRTRLEREEIRRSLGGASSTDLLNARVNFNTDQTLLLEQELRVNIARKELNILLTREPDEILKVKKEIDVPLLELSLPELQQRSLDASATLQAAQHRMLAVEEQVKIADSVVLAAADSRRSVWIYKSQFARRRREEARHCMVPATAGRWTLL